MSIDDIARALGVSTASVSRAINNTGRLSGKTRKKILDYIDEVGFTPNAAAKNLATTKTHNIAFVMPLYSDSSRSSFFLECLFGVCKAASATKYDVIITGDDIASIKHILSSKKVDGIILSRDIIDDETIKGLQNFNIPIVLTRFVDIPGIIQVGYDGRAAFRDLTLRLMDKWDGDIGLILTKKTYPANNARSDGFIDAHDIHGKEPVIMWDADEESEIYQAFDELHKKGIRNIICGDDSVCISLLSITNEYTESGYNAGKSGHDGINIASFHGNQYLLTHHSEIPLIMIAPEKLGEVGGKMLISKIEGNEVPEKTFLEYTIKI